MATEEDNVELSDDELFDSMITGTFEEPSNEEVEDDSVEDTEDVDADDENEDQEDTDQEDDSEADEELDEADDGELDEDSDEEDEDEEENTLVDTDSTEEEDEGSTEDDESEEDASTDTEDNTDTEAGTDGTTAKTTDGIDYKAFYDALNVDITVNGNQVKGFTDPNKLIAAQQMAGGFSDKMTAFKKYRPYMAPLKDRGMLDDPEKFNLAMNLVDGDMNALKHHIQTLGIDPLELDMETISYEGKDTRASEAQMSLDETMETAKSRGVEERMRQVIGTDWDQSSFNEFVNNSAVRNDLLEHMSTGAYEQVQSEIADIKRTDINNSFGSMTSVDQYRAAVKSLAQRNQQARNAQVVQEQGIADQAAKVKAEKAKILKSRKDEEYKVKAAAREKKVTEQRKKAASVSKRKKKTTSAKPKFDPLALEGDDLDAMMNQLIENGHKGVGL